VNPHRTAVDTDLIFLLALLGFYLLRRFLGAQQQQGQKPMPKPRPSDEGEPAFDDALEEIRRALGMEPIPETPGPAPERPPRPLPAPEPARRPRGEFHVADTGRPEFEERFLRGESTFGDPLKGHTHAKPVRKAVEPTPPTPRPRRLLATRKQLRDAFVLKEVLGPPRARKKEIR